MEVKSDPIAYTMQSTLLNWSNTAGFTFGKTCTMESLKTVKYLKNKDRFQVCQHQQFVFNHNYTWHTKYLAMTLIYHIQPALITDKSNI